MQIVDGHRNGKVILKLANAQFCEVTVSSRMDKVVLLFEDITERVRAEERINFMAHYDALTGLPNRGYFSEQVDADLARRRTEAGNDMVMLMIVDIDDFKHVNDTTGHLVGDRLLIESAERLSRALGPRSLVARLGGDEFIVYRGHIGTIDQANIEVDDIIDAFAEPFAIDGMSLSTNISIGLVTSSTLDETLDALMTKADLALYMAKGDGKARSQIFHAQMDIDYHYRQRLKTDLRAAVSAGALTLAFQPQLDVTSRKVVACEALARWVHPELGSVPPSTFIPLAEEMGLISEITAWVLREATLQCQDWPGDIGVAVNISARDFRGGDIGSMVATALERSGLDPARLEVEITETVLIEERDTALGVLDALAAQGISIALDDFGTGYSSLSYLSALPFTKLKIDRSFVSNIATDQRALKLLANVARLGRDLGLTVTAEGVETEDQLTAMLSKTRIDQVQGYFFSRPLPPRDIAELIGRLNAAPGMADPIRKHG
jgi:diguanylate cyclase (GGDEF)-like protein